MSTRILVGVYFHLPGTVSNNNNFRNFGIVYFMISEFLSHLHSLESTCLHFVCCCWSLWAYWSFTSLERAMVYYRETPEGHKEDLGVDAVMIIIIVMKAWMIIVLITACVYYRVMWGHTAWTFMWATLLNYPNNTLKKVFLLINLCVMKLSFKAATTSSVVSDVIEIQVYQNIKPGVLTGNKRLSDCFEVDECFWNI